MLPGFISFGLLPAKLVCPRTLVAVPVVAGKKSTRLLDVSPASTFPLASTATPTTPASEDAEASGKDPASGALAVKPTCPITAVAAAPEAAPAGNTRIRLSAGVAT